MKKVLILDTSILCVWLDVPGMATLIETGNHIAQASHSRRERGEDLGELMRLSADERTPWAVFSDQYTLWTKEKLKALSEYWPELAQGQRLSLGDATIKDVAEYYAQMGLKIEILTGDKGLKAYEPSAPEIPRRRQRR